MGREPFYRNFKEIDEENVFGTYATVPNQDFIWVWRRYQVSILIVPFNLSASYCSEKRYVREYSVAKLWAYIQKRINLE